MVQRCSDKQRDTWAFSQIKMCRRSRGAVMGAYGDRGCDSTLLFGSLALPRLLQRSLQGALQSPQRLHIGTFSHLLLITLPPGGWGHDIRQASSMSRVYHMRYEMATSFSRSPFDPVSSPMKTDDYKMECGVQHRVGFRLFELEIIRSEGR